MRAENIDSKINEYSYKMVNNLKNERVNLNEIDKALNVLCNDGVYGYYVYCKSKSSGEKEKQKIESTMFTQFIADVVKEFNEIVYSNRSVEHLEGCKHLECFKDYDEYFSRLSEDIHKLLFFKDILEKILIYARYHAKAVGDKNE